MRELNSVELEEVNGGVALALIGIALGIIGAQEEIGNFFGGVLDGYHGTHYMEP